MRGSYTFQIHKGDHVGDLHVHAYLNKNGRRPLGKYRLPSLEPLAGTTHKLNQTEIGYLREWLGSGAQLAKLQDCLRSTVFDLHKITLEAARSGVLDTEDGETYINIRIPITRRWGT